MVFFIGELYSKNNTKKKDGKPMIKMYAFDLDGTLLKSDHTIDKDTLDLIHKMSKDGKKIVIATGRAKNVMEDIVVDNGLDCDIIINNGHEIRAKGKEPKYIPFDWEVLEQVLTVLKKNKMHIAACASKEERYSFHDRESFYNKHIEMSEAINGTKYVNVESSLFNKESYTKNFRHIPDVSGYKDTQVLKIDAKTIVKEDKMQCLAELEKIPNLMLSSSYNAYIEIIQDNADKGRALLDLASSYGIDSDEIAAFGDGTNDLEMLSCVGHSCAMGNSFDGVKEVARYVTDTNDNQGVYKQLLKMLEIQ